MLTLLRLDKSYVLPLILLIAIALWIPSFDIQASAHCYNSNPMPLYAILQNFVPQNSVLSIIISIIMMLINTYLLVRLNSKYKMIQTGTYFPGILYMMIVTGHEALRQINPILFASFFFLLAIHELFSSYKKNSAIGEFFKSAFWISFGSLFYFNLIFFEIIVVLGLLLLRPIDLHEYAALIIGSITPIIFTLGVYFYNDSLIEIINTIKTNIISDEGYSFMSLFYTIFYIFTIFLFIIAVSVTFSASIKKVSIRKEYSLFLFLFILSIILFFAIPGASVELLAIIAIPFSYFFANYLININSTALGEVIFTAFVSLYITQMILS